VTAKVHLEHLTTQHVARFANLHTCLADWREAALHTPDGRRYASILALDVVAACSIARGELPNYMATLRALLAPGGRACVLMLSASDAATADSLSNVLRSLGFLAGATVATEAEVSTALESQSLCWEAKQDVTAEYAATLRLWRARLVAGWRQACLAGIRDTELRRCVAAVG
jgi:cyclopropane fatty-acyl-phospholipid synthase-like methyltransferase